MALLLLLIYSQIDGKMQRNGLNNITMKVLTYPEMSISCCLCCLCVGYVLYMCCLCVAYVLSMCCLCVVYVLSMCYLCVV